MRIRFNVGLEPEIYDSHSYAIKTLRGWQQQEKARNDETDIVLQRRIQFHRDLYLSGLFLHELAPQLPSMLTQTLLQDKVNCQTLVCQIRSAGLSLESSEDNGLSEQQWLKLTSMLEGASLPNQQSEPLNLSSIEQQLEQLQQGQEQLSKLFNNLPAVADTVQPHAELDLAAQFSQLKQGQDKLMAQIKSLSSQLAQTPASAPANDETPNLETQLERARRVKSKGLW
ncbi:hypothetical protein ACVBIL_10225 [Shewanella sp. 125m-7]